MTMPRFNALVEEWNAHPPTHLLLAAFVGYEQAAAKGSSLPDKPQTKPRGPTWENESIEELLSRWNSVAGAAIGTG